MAAESFDDFCRASIDLLRARHLDFVIVGGVAVTALGEPRFTADLDAIVFADPAVIAGLLRAAATRGFAVDPEAELAAAAAGQSLRLDRGRFHFDLIVRSLFIEDQALERSRRIKVFRRLVPFPSPEDLVVLKIVAGRPRDLLDVEGIVRRHAAALDRPYIERTLQAVCELAEDHDILARWRRVTQVR